MKELLTSDRLNFLVWRYLLEGNYRETAAKFQKEWQIQAPHRHFDFAPHVKSHALVSVVNRGLLYNALEREYVQTQVPGTATASASASADAQYGVFGPFVPQPPLNEENLEDDEEPEQEPEPAAVDEVENSRKRQVDPQHQLANGNPAKRPRLANANGYENGADATTDPMEIDQHNHADNNHAYPSPLEGEQIPTPVAHTEGPEQGTQIDKVDELSPETIYIRLGPHDDSSALAAPAANNVTATAPPTAETSQQSRTNPNPMILHCEWNPKDPSRLAAAGTDALARVWTVSRATSSEHLSDHVDGVHHASDSLMEDKVSPNTTVTAMAWDSDGDKIAVATQLDGKARISIWSASGTLLQHFDGVDPPIIRLHWNQFNNSLLSIAPDKKGAIVTVFPPTLSTSCSYFLPEHDMFSEPLDAAWTSESEFVLCGGEKLVLLKCAEDSITPVKDFEARHDDDFFTEVQFDQHSSPGLIATASEKGVIDIWSETGQRRSIEAHDGHITSLRWQPIKSDPPDDERLLASGGEDGTIAIWNVRAPEDKPKFLMTIDNYSPVVALAFTPDGAFLAGATTDRILIWKVGEYAMPRASWTRASHPGWLSPKTNGKVDEEDTHCLCWDSTGQKLAFGVNHRLAVINFR